MKTQVRNIKTLILIRVLPKTMITSNNNSSNHSNKALTSPLKITTRPMMILTFLKQLEFQMLLHTLNTISMKSNTFHRLIKWMATLMMSSDNQASNNNSNSIFLLSNITLVLIRIIGKQIHLVIKMDLEANCNFNLKRLTIMLLFFLNNPFNNNKFSLLIFKLKEEMNLILKSVKELCKRNFSSKSKWEIYTWSKKMKVTRDNKERLLVESNSSNGNKRDNSKLLRDKKLTNSLRKIIMLSLRDSKLLLINGRE